MNFAEIKEKINKKYIIIAAAVLLVIVAAIIVISVSSNNYKSAITNYEKALSGKATNINKYIDYTSNGFGAKELKSIAKNLKELDEDYYDELEEALCESDDGKVKILIDYKEKIDSDDLKDLRKSLHNVADMFLDNYLDAIDSDDIDDFADASDMPKAKVKALISDAKKYCKMLKNAEIEEGYEISCTITTEEDDFDEDSGKDKTLTVVKIGNKWVVTNDIITFVSKILYHYKSSF